ncbi:hypothetical protein L2E76_11560 [Planktothrix agardhii 1811]|uniref:hypothetical protein n=1 Tax=Planktothrix agardhii TaxID=1160 RepID=UPI001F241973|nr:hypothetical protein [Planktothrix agardhii]MCF3581154.1 hypothetical protein [Planktothrix agardhii 1811]
MRAALLSLVLVSQAAAEAPLTADQFDALTLGRTLTWAEFGQVYGVEQYLPDRRVRWTVLGDDCKLGHWYPEGQMICFQYEDDPEPDCWTITPGATGLDARYAGSAADSVPVVVEETTEPMACFGPEVGA